MLPRFVLSATLLLPLVGCASVAADCCTPREDLAGLNEAKARFLDAWSKAEGETWTTAKLDAVVDNSADFLSFDAMSQEKTVIRGHEAYAAIWGPGMNGFKTAKLSETESVRTWTHCDVGITCSLVRIEGTFPDGTKIDLAGHMTLGWRRDAKTGWRAVHEHMSLGVKP